MLEPRCRSMLLSLAALSLSASAVPAGAAGEVSRNTGGYLETVLPNGLRVALVERRSVPMVSATAVVGAGSALEEEDFSGASHLLEHLLFNGTSEMTQEELYAAVDDIGGYNNAHTDEDHTYYVLLLPSRHLRRGLEIQAAMLFDSTLPAEQFDKERKIVLEEIAKDRSRPGHDTDVGTREALWPGTAWGRPVIGTDESLGGIERDRVWAYYKRQYVPNNVRLLLMGDFDAESVLPVVAEVYGGVPAGPAPPAVSDPFTSRGDGHVVRIEAADSGVRVTVALRAPGPCEPGGAEAVVLAELLSSESGPLRRAVGADRVSRLGASVVPRAAGSALMVTAEVAEGSDPEAVARDLLVALAGVGRFGLGQPGFEPGPLTRVARGVRFERQLMGQRIHYVGMMRADALAACGGELRPLVGPDGRNRVRPREVAAVAARVLGDVATAARVVVAGAVAAAPAPLELPALAAERPPAREGSTPGAALDRALPNGLRVVVAQEDGAAVTGIHLLVRDRTAREPEGKGGIADLLHRLLPHGTAISDRAALHARLERVGAELKTADADFIPYDDYYTSPSHSFVRLELPAEGWLPALDLLAEMVRLPALRAEDLESLRAARGSRAERESASPSAVGRLVYRRALLGQGHPLARSLDGTAESLASVSHADMQAFAREYLDPAGLILSIVGPEDPEDVFGAVEERFASARTGGGSWEVPPWPVTGEPGAAVERELGAQQWRVYLGRIAPAGSRDRAALRLLAGLLSDRLAMTLREKEGLAYRLGASVAFQGEPDLAWLTVEVGTRPGNREAVLRGVRREMERLRAEMAQTEEIDRVRATLRSRALMRRLTTINRARFLGVRAFTGVPNHEDLDALEALDAVTRDQLEGLATPWLEDRLYRVVVIQ